jgi:D-sedoheptulose 7-phosphate isomerase
MRADVERSSRPAERVFADALAGIAAARLSLAPSLEAAAEGVPDAARVLAERFAAGATLFALGSGASAADAGHVAVEFAHPVIVGKRALPALSLASESAALSGAAAEGGWGGAFADLLGRLAAPGDAVLALEVDGSGEGGLRALEAARSRGLATFALVGGEGGELAKSGAAEHLLRVEERDALRVREAHVTLYHLLWEGVQFCLEEGARVGLGGDADAAALYPFLGRETPGAEALLPALRCSTAAKLRQLAALRTEAFERNAAALLEGAGLLARAFERGGQLLAFGNGGSARDAESAAQLFLAPPRGRGVRARSLAADPGLVTALANDAGFDVVFARQLAAAGRPADVALGLSTSGDSENLLRGFAESRRRGLATIGLAGYAGGRLAAEGGPDVLLVVPSDSVHRIQEVQRSLLHALWELGQAARAGEAPCAS